MAQTEPRRQSTTTGGGTEKKLSGIYDGEYFEILHRQEDTLFVKCNTCGPEGLQLRASAKSNGNILKHVKRRHPELLAKIREEKHIKTRSSVSGQTSNNAFAPSAEKKPKPMTFKEEIVFVEQNNDSECMTSSYITTSAPDEKSPFAANVMVHLQPQPIHSNIIEHQQHHVITSQHSLSGGDHHIISARDSGRADHDDEEEDEEEHHPEEDEGPQDCENVEYLTSNMHHDTGLVDMDNVGHHHTSAQNDMRHRSIVVSTSGPAVPSIGHSSSIGNRTGLATKRRLEIPRVDDDDEDTDQYEPGGVDPLDAPDELTGQTFFGAQASKFPSINRTIDHSSEIIALRKKLMIREFELVQQKHQLEIELLQKELEFKRAQHQKIIACLNKKLCQK